MLTRVEASGGVAFWTDETLRARTGVIVAFTERTGGVSAPPFDSLNLAAHVGDDPEADVLGALNAGLQPVLTTCARDGDIPRARSPLSPSETEIPPHVPSISTWQDLLDLLEN